MVREEKISREKALEEESINENSSAIREALNRLGLDKYSLLDQL